MAAYSRLSLPQSIHDVLHRAIKTAKLDKKFKQYEFRRHWQSVVGDIIAKHAHPERFSGNSLVVRVDSASWAQELSFHKESILKRLKRVLNAEKDIDDLVFYVSGVRNNGSNS